MIKTSIRRPVAVAMTYASVAALGVFAWRNIPLELLPDTQLPQLTVTAQWPGASPETVEAFLTAKLEAEIQQIRGVDSISSSSRENNATITVKFQRDTDMDFARLDLAERLAAVQADSTLPPAVRAVTVTPYVPREFADQQQPLLTYDFTGPYTQEALFRHLEEVVVPELGRVDGVAQAVADGGRRRLIEVRVDQDQVTSLGLAPSEIQAAISGLDLVQEAGVVREDAREWTVTFVNRPEALGDIEETLLVTRGGTVVRLGDLATIHDTFEDPLQLHRRNGEPSLGLRIYKEQGTNAVSVADRAKARMDQVSRLNPFGARFVNTWDESERIRDQLSDLRFRALVAAVVIFLVLLIFLRSFRSAGVIFATIAFSVLISLNLIYFGGLALNILTLMGLAMGFGLIVDNSIVVLENVFRRWQKGEDPRVAADLGSREVVLPIFASTATTIIVFVPFVYLQDELRAFYLPLAIVVVLTLVASLFVAFSFIPGVAARLLRKGRRSKRSGGSDGAGRRRPPIYVRFYEALVGFTLRHPWSTVAVTLVCLGGSWYLFDTYVNTGRVFNFGGGAQRTYVDVRIGLERGENLERSDQLARFFEEKLAQIPQVEEFETTVSASSGRIMVTFPDSLELTAIPVVIHEQMYAYSLTFTGVDVRVYGNGPSFYGGSSGAPLNYRVNVLGYNYLKVREIAEELARRISSIPRVQSVDTNVSGYGRDRATEFRLVVDRAALARYGMTVQDLGRQIQAFVGGNQRTSQFKLGGEDTQFQVKMRDAEDIDVLALREAMITGPNGGRLRLGDLVRIEPQDILASITRQNQQYVRTVGYEFRGPAKLGDIYNEELIESTVVPPGYRVEGRSSYYAFGAGEAKQIYTVLFVSIVLVYMVTAALFESLRQPLCVLLTVPMALVGVFMIFFYTGATFTREAYIGVIMMGGIVVNNSILLVDHVNRVRQEGGRSLQEAILRGTLDRVRPILMTTTTTVLGLLPLVLFSETADANIWNALGFTLIGGLLSSTLFVLTVTPALYLLFEKGPEAKRLWAEQHASARVAAAPTAGAAGMGPEPAPQPG